MKKNNKITINYIYSSLYQIMLIIVPFITAPYLARTLEPTAVGINSYVSAIVKIFSLLGLIGLNNYSIREVAYTRNNKEKLSKIFSELIILRGVCFIITLVIYLGYAYFSEYSYYLYIQLVALISAFLDISWLYMGLEEFKVTVTRSMIVKIINVICIFVLIKSPEDLGLFMFLSTIFTVIGNSLLYFGVKKRIGKYNFKNLNIKKHVIPTAKLFIPEIASVAFLQLDKVMIENLSSFVSGVGFYDQAERLVKVPLALITALSTIMLPRISYEFKNNNTEAIKKYITSALIFCMFLSIPLMFGIAAISSNFIPWFYGEGYDGIITIMIFVSPIIFFNALSSVSGLQYLTATNKTKILTLSYVAGAIIDIIINFILIPKYGPVGAAIGTVSAEFTIFLIQFIYIRDILDKKKLIPQFLKYFICGIIMFISCYSYGYYTNATAFNTIIQVIIGMLVYFILLVITKDEMLKIFIQKVENIIFKQKGVIDEK